MKSLLSVTLYYMCMHIYVQCIYFSAWLVCFILFALQCYIYTAFILHFWMVKSCTHMLKTIIKAILVLILSPNQISFIQMHYTQSNCPALKVYLFLCLNCVKIGRKIVMKIWVWIRDVYKTLNFASAEIWDPCGPPYSEINSQ